MSAPVDPAIRFHRGYIIDATSGCWLWQKSRYSNGYGWLKVFGRVVSAHRYAFEMLKGPIPAGHEILHSCDVRHCVNPDHMRAGTHGENMREARDRGRMRSGPSWGARLSAAARKGALSRQSLQVRISGRVFGSIKEAERAFGVPHGTVRYWLAHKPETAQRITREEYERDAE